MKFNPLKTITAMAAAAIIAAADSDSDNPTTVNACISPQACFQNVKDDTIDYCIDSYWNIKYPKDLRKNVYTLDHITPIDFKSPDFDNCGWNMGVNSVSRQSVARGAIYYKAHNGSLEIRPPTFPQDTAVVINTMKHTYPIVEIMLILLFTVIIPIGCPVLFAIGCCLKGIGQSVVEKIGRRSRMRAQRKAEKREKVVVRKKAPDSETSTMIGSGSPSTLGKYGGWEKEMA